MEMGNVIVLETQRHNFSTKSKHFSLWHRSRHSWDRSEPNTASTNASFDDMPSPGTLPVI